MFSDNSGRRLVITGSEGLIGRELASHFVATHEVLRLDIALGHQLNDEAFVAEWFSENRELDGMIVCHAYNPVPLPAAERRLPQYVSLDEIREYLETNLVSAFSVMRSYIMNNVGGALVAVSSTYGIVSPRHDIYGDYVKPIGYSMSKAGLIGMCRYLSTFYAPQYRINTVVLGGVYEERFDKDFVEQYERNVPMRRMMNVTEVTGVFDFLIGPGASYAIGSEYRIDGGWITW